MNKTFLSLIGVLVAAGVIGTLVATDPGYVLISYNGISVQTSLWVFLLLILVLILGGYLLRRFVRLVSSTGLKISDWRASRMQSRSRQHTTLGVNNLLKGHWLAARRYLVMGAEGSSSAFSNYLGAALAASLEGNSSLSAELIDKARQENQDPDHSIDIWQAQICLMQNDFKAAELKLAPLTQYPRVREQLLTIYAETESYLTSWELLVAHRKDYAKDDFQSKIMDATRALLNQWLATGESQPVRLPQLWQELDKSRRKNHALVALYAQNLVQSGLTGEAEALLRKTINGSWDDSLVIRYGCLERPDSSDQIKVAEKWLEKFPDSAALLLSIGRLYRRADAMEKSRKMIEASILKNNSTEARKELAGIYDRLGEAQLCQKLLAEIALEAN